MAMNVLELLSVEREALLEALRRDLRCERNLAKRDPNWAIWHQRNVQLNLRLLEVLNPKDRHFTEQTCKAFLRKPASLKKSQPVCLTAPEYIKSN